MGAEKRDAGEARRLDRLAAEAEAEGRFARAVELLERARAADPGEPRIVLNLGRALKLDGRPEEAEAELRLLDDEGGGRLMTPAPPSLRADALILRGLIAHEAGKRDQAAEFYRRALAVEPECADAWNDQGVLEFQAGNYGAAAMAFRKAVEIEPALADAWFNLADALDECGDAEGAARSRLEWKRLGGR